MALEGFHQMAAKEAAVKLLACCHCGAWADALAGKRPYSSLLQLQEVGDSIWFKLSEEQWLEAFAGHPKIGDLSSLREKYANTKVEAGAEQSGVNGADENTLVELQKLNADYEKKFGFIFIVFATGKTAAEMLDLLKKRLRNTRQQELRNAAMEQSKITKLRMEKLL